MVVDSITDALSGVDRSLDRLDQLLQRDEPCTIWVTGPIGSGRSVLARRLAERHGEAVTLVQLLDLDEPDAVIHGLVQVAANVGGDAERQALVRDWAAPERGGREAIEAMRRAGRSLLVVRIPSSWMRSAKTCEVDNNSSWERARALLRAWSAPTSEVHRVLVVDGKVDGDLQGASATQVIRLPSVQVGLDFLASDDRWGEYAAPAHELGRALRPDGRFAPSILRLAVGAVALGVPTAKLATLIERGSSTKRTLIELSNRLASPLGREDGDSLRRAVSQLLRVREPVEETTFLQWLALPTDHQPFLTRCLAYSGAHLRIHPVVRDALLQHPRLCEGQVDAHRGLAEHYRGLDGAVTPEGLSGRQLLAWLEKVHHLAHSDDDDAWQRQCLPAREFYWDRGRYLSVTQRDYARAADVYQRSVDRFPDDDYAWHNLGYNLDKARRPPEVIEEALRKAVELDADNPWWNTRYIGFLIRQHQDGRARQAFQQALAQIDPDGERTDDEPWLAEQFYRWIITSWLEAGSVSDALEVLKRVPMPFILDHTQLHALATRIAQETIALLRRAAHDRDQTELHARLDGLTELSAYLSEDTSRRLEHEMPDQALPLWFLRLCETPSMERPKLRRALYAIHRNLDDLLTSSQFDAVDAILVTAPFEWLHPSCRLATLRVTAAAREHLPHWSDALSRVAVSLERDGLSPDELLRGLY